MAKKGLLVLVLAAVVAGGAFAQGFDIGGGFVFDGGRVGGMSASGQGASSSDYLRHTGFGGFLFVGASFAELAIAFMGGPATDQWEFSEGGVTESGSHSGSFTALDFSLALKLPMPFSDNMTVFPMLGIGYNVVLASRDEDGNDMFDSSDFSASDLSTFRIALGGGADFAINEGMFFRASVQGYYRFAPSLFRDAADEWNAFGVNADSHGGFGAIIRLAVGLRF